MPRSMMSLMVVVAIAALPGLSRTAIAGTFTTLYSFQMGTDGAYPEASVLELGGQIYGTTARGGGLVRRGGGTVFVLNPASGSEKVLHAFKDREYGPVAGLIKVGHLLYGTTYSGGSSRACYFNCGTIFSLNPKTGSTKTVYSFQGGSDGSSPEGTMIEFGGVLYGTTALGGNGSTKCSNGCGTVFSFDPAKGTEKVLHAFTFEDGAVPIGGVVEAGGTLYGTANQGGNSSNCGYYGCGVVFSVDPNTGTERVIHFFEDGKDGSSPESTFLELGGKLYGTTFSGGDAGGNGTIFSVNLKTGKEKIEYAFRGGSDGFAPGAGLTRAGSLLYGTTGYGGKGCPSLGCGTIFSFDPSTGAVQVLHAFQNRVDGSFPQASLVKVGDALVGTAVQGGRFRAGTVFAFTP